MTSKLYMTIKNLTPKKTDFSVTGEKINAIIERDVALTFLIMLFGLLLKNDSGFRGFPAGWLYSGSDPALHSRPELFFVSLMVSVLLVVAGEIVTLIIRKATEPDASVSSGADFKANQATVYANTYDDTALQTETATSVVKSRSSKSWKPAVKKSAGETKVPALPLNRRENPVFKSLGIDPERGSKSSASGKTNSGDAVMKGVFTAFSVIFLLVIGMAVALLPDGDTVNPVEYEDDLSYDFYTEPEFLQDKCDDAFELLMSRDKDALSELGGGSPAKLLNMTDWGYVSYYEDNRALTIDETDTAFIRFYAETDDNRQYIVAFKFEGGDLAYDESTAELTGIAACPYDVWEEYSPDNDWDRFAEEVKAQMKYVGDVEYADQNILIW